VALDEGVHRVDPIGKYARPIPQEVALHPQARELGAQPCDLHLLGTPGLATFDQPHRLLLEFEPVARPLVVVIPVLLAGVESLSKGYVLQG
jgi:hypothetical protein